MITVLLSEYKRRQGLSAISLEGHSYVWGKTKGISIRMKRYKWHYLFGMVFAAVFCIFRLDTSTDCVLEMALTAVLHNGNFSYSPFTGEAMAMSAYWSPMTWIYVVTAQILDVHPVLIGKLLMPFVVVFFFITAWKMLFEQLFGKNEQTVAALWILLISSLVFCFSKPYDFTGLWEAPWTDKSVALYVLLPLTGVAVIWVIKKLFYKTESASGIEKISEQDGLDHGSRHFKIQKKYFTLFLAIWAVSAIVSIAFNGCILFNSTYAFPDNRFKMNKEIMEIREMVEGVPEVKMLAPFEVEMQIRDCDDKVRLVRSPYEETGTDSIKEALEKYQNVNIVVLSKADADEDMLCTLGYTRMGSTENYEVYKFVPDLGKYTVTQFASVTELQSMIYVITDWDGHLIIVDGGWKEDAEGLLNLILDHGGRVDAWIITHPHPDHVGAFNEVYASGQVEIGTIYTVPMDYETYKNKANWWDVFEIYDEFVNLTTGADNIVYLEEGDEIDLFGLKMEVFHSFDMEEMAEDTDPCNNGGMIFKLSAKRDSILFLSDVGAAYSAKLLERWGDNLAADYVQMGHHGNGGMDESVYRVIAPKTAFFDAPESLMQNTELNAPVKRALMESLGTKILYYATAPNTIVME